MHSRMGGWGRVSSLWTVMDRELIILRKIQSSGLNKCFSEMREVVVSLCKYKTCLALINQIGMCVNSKFMGWGMSIVSKTPQIHVLTIKILAETFVLSYFSQIIIWNHSEYS